MCNFAWYYLMKNHRIGTGSVITKNIPNNAVAIGVLLSISTRQEQYASQYPRVKFECLNTMCDVACMVKTLFFS